MSNNQTTSRRWWHKQQSRGSEPDGAAAFSDDDAAAVSEELRTVGSMTQEELRQMISDTVQRTLEDLLPKQLARQRSMLESELKWHLGDLIKEAIAAGGPGAADTAAQEQASQETPKINTSIDWSFLE